MIKAVLQELARALPGLMRSGRGWSIEIRGTQSQVKVTVTETFVLRSDKVLEDA